MNKEYCFYNYEQCYAHYTKCIMNIRQAKIHGEVILAKPVLLLSLIDGIDANLFKNNQFCINDRLEERYAMLMKKYTIKSQFPDVTGIEKPFWHLETDGFWHLHYHDVGVYIKHTPSKAWLKENVSFASFDDDLWILLQNEAWRMKLREYIVEHKLTDGCWNSRMVAEGFGVLMALVLAG